MKRIEAINPATATDEAKTLLDTIQKTWGATPTLVTTMANAPAALAGYWELQSALTKGHLRPSVRERISIAVAQENGCEYCLSAHTTLGRNIHIPDDELENARDAESSDPKIQAALQFAVRVLETKGHVDANDFAAVRAAGYSDSDIVEITANVALNVFTNYMNHVTGAVNDWPRVEVSVRH